VFTTVQLAAIHKFGVLRPFLSLCAGYDYLIGSGLGRCMQEAPEAEHLDKDKMVANSFQGGNTGNCWLEKSKGEDGKWHYNKEGPRRRDKGLSPFLLSLLQVQSRDCGRSSNIGYVRLLRIHGRSLTFPPVMLLAAHLGGLSIGSNIWSLR
jgi:hypothetical protein